MTKPKSDPRYSPMPLSSFDPRYREMLLRGAMQEEIIPCGSSQKAHRFQMVLCQFRKRVKEEFPNDRSQWEPLYACVVGLTPDKSGVRLYPRHSEFSDILGPAAASGVEAAAPPTLSHDPLEEFDPE